MTFKLLKYNRLLFLKPALLPILFVLLFFSYFSTSKSKSELITEQELAKGAIYKNYYVTTHGKTHSVHVVELDLKAKNVQLKVLKAKDLTDELMKIHDIANWHDSLNIGTVIAAINANFWRAYTNYPIGPTVIDGEPVTMSSYKQWSSGFFDIDGRLYIDAFRLNAELILPNGQSLPINSANHRRDSTENVLYNRFAGHFVPRIHTRDMKSAVSESLEDSLFNDSTEIEYQMEELMATIAEEKRLSNAEHSYTKIALKYLDKPVINKEIECQVVSIGSGSVEIPENGCVISLSPDSKFFIGNRPGIFKLRILTNQYQNILFKNAVCGTPRLVRQGIAKHEAYEEGSKGRRFIHKMLPRTAIGTNKDKSKVFLVAIEIGSRSESTSGANLEQLADIMKQIGCHEAMNLDGGGSTTMIVDGYNVIYKSNPFHSRRIAVAIAIVETNFENNLLKDWFKDK